MNLRLSILTVALASTALAGCATTSSRSSASAQLAPATGQSASGTLTLVPMGNGVQITGNIAGLKANGTHGFHIHEKGDCSAADFTSAGGHFNPTAQPHGRASSDAHHLGDQDNLSANANGVAQVDAHFDGVVIGSGTALNDVVGKAVIVHADPDDYATQPTGNAGGRIACGVIR